MKAQFPLSSFWAASTLFGLCFSIESDLTVIFGVIRIFVVMALLDKFGVYLFRVNAFGKRTSAIFKMHKPSDLRRGQ